MRQPLQRWNATEAERLAPSPADDVLPRHDARWVRAVDVDAPPETTWRWLCQLRAAPYSYDLIDNLGRRSPRTLTPGLDDLAAGQKAMIVMRVASFERPRHVTFVSSDRGPVRMAIAYVVGDRRLVAHVNVCAPRALLAPLCVGDAVMMRRQLLTLKSLAEATGRSAWARANASTTAGSN